ncbi:hypothetical protein KR009_000087 [Drosophila setifemur]|nr:hypothetical protein KR009_000087 [Drosophila setifemur]
MAQFSITIASISLLLVLVASPALAGIIAQPSFGYAGSSVDEHAVAHTQQNVVRSFDGTVSHYAKSVATPFSQVHKQDTRISNNVYQPTVAKTISYAPAPAQPSHLFTQAAPAEVYHQAPGQVYHQAPAQVYHQAPAQVYHQAPAHVQSPAVYHHPSHVETPTVYQQAHIPSHVVSHQPAAVVHYSPAESVSHMSFDGFGTHWGF